MAVAERMGHLDEPNDYARINAIGKREDEIAEDINHIAALRGPNPFDTNGRHPSEPHPLDVLFAEDIPDLATLGRRVAELCNDGHKIYPPEVFIVSRELFGSDADVGEDDGLEGPLWDSFFHHRQRQETA